MAGSDVISRAPEPECCLAFVLHISTDKDKPVKDLKKIEITTHTCEKTQEQLDVADFLA